MPAANFAVNRRTLLQLGLGTTVLGAVGCSPAKPASKKADSRTTALFFVVTQKFLVEGIALSGLK